MKNTASRISVLVRARDEAAHLPRLIEGLSNQSTRPDEVVLVDSGSTDSTVEIAAAAGWKVVHLDPGDFSFGKSLNVGFEACSSEIVVIMSAHVYPTRADYIRLITQRVSPDGRSIAYGRQIGDYRTKFSEKVLMSTWFPDERITDQGHAFTNNANACVPRALWKELRFDESLSGLEDIAFSIGVLSIGGKIVYEHEAEIVHVHEETYFQIAKRYEREALAYKRIFPGERMSWIHACRLALRNVVRDSALAFRERRLMEVWPSIMAFRFSQFFGAWRGFRRSGGGDSELLKRMYYPTENKPTDSLHPLAPRIEYSTDV